MRHSYKQVRELALGLSYDQRNKLSEELWWSLHPPGEDSPQEEIDAAWAAEIERRVAEIDSGATKMMPAEEFLAGLRSRLPDKPAKTRRK